MQTIPHSMYRSALCAREKFVCWWVKTLDNTQGESVIEKGGNIWKVNSG